jgi:hypothetical protein
MRPTYTELLDELNEKEYQIEELESELSYAREENLDLELEVAALTVVTEAQVLIIAELQRQLQKVFVLGVI